jgi:hypothetical protein
MHAADRGNASGGAQLKADALLVCEILLCVSLFVVQPLGWYVVSGVLLPDPSALAGRLLLGMAGMGLSGAATLGLARRVEKLRLELLPERPGPPSDVLALILVGLTIVVVAVVGWWFLIEAGPEPLLAPK